MKLLLTGYPGQEHVGHHFLVAARELNLAIEMANSTQAFEASFWNAKWNWWLRGHRPARLQSFGEKLISQIRRNKPTCLLTLGIAPLEMKVLQEIGQQGILRINFLTDDPWNPAHRAPWFIKGLRFYDWIFSPRKANLDSLQALGGPQVRYLPFAYAPEIHFPEQATSSEKAAHYEVDLLFVGGADSDRVRLITPLIREDFKVHLYGGYWDRYPFTKGCCKGYADPRTLRLATQHAKVTLCLARRANRDDHSMRTFEVAAMGGCMLLEDTPMHRELFGKEGEAAFYFRDPKDLSEKLRWLLDHAEVRERMREAAHRLITQGKNTYKDRLSQILEIATRKDAGP